MMLDLLRRVADSVQRAPDTEGLTRTLLTILQELTALESVYLTRIDHGVGEQTILFANNSGQLQIPESVSVPWSDTLCRWALAESVFHTDDVGGRWPESSAGQALGLQTYVSVPVYLDDGDLFGTLCGASCERVAVEDGLREVMILFSTLIAHQVAREERTRSAILRAESAETQLQELELLADVLETCQGAGHYSAAMLDILQRFRSKGWIGMVFLRGNIGFERLDQEHDPDLVVPFDLLEQQQYSTVEWLPGAVEVQPLWEALGLPWARHLALVPVFSEGRLLGGLLLSPVLVDDFRIETLLRSCSSALSQLAERVRTLIRLQEANEELSLHALHDVLTDLPNRRHMLEALERMLAAAARNGPPVHVAFIDLDRFKAINDDHGHEAGDAFLHEVGRRLAATVRASDLVGRIGGDEFLVIVQSNPEIHATLERAGLLRRLRAALTGDYDLPMAAIPYAGPSIGIITSEPDELNGISVVKRADAVMYADKAMRRASN